MKLFNKIKNLKKNKSLHHLEAYAEKAKAIFGPVSSKTGTIYRKGGPYEQR
jgi:hypothetical protein